MRKVTVPYRRHLGFNASLLAVFLAWWLGLGIAPVDRFTWLLENVLTALIVLILVAGYRHLTLSRLSYVLIFTFLCVHTLGSHYTYSLVPWDAWIQACGLPSVSQWLGWQRNNFDRIVHFSYGLLLAYPCRELFLRWVNVRGFWGYFLPLDLTLSSSVLYELVEWGAAVVFGGDAGMHFLGIQGDLWDAHKDVLCAAVGAVIAMTLTLAVNRTLQRDFAHEWAESLRTKNPEPLGDEALERMLRQRSGDA